MKISFIFLLSFFFILNAVSRQGSVYSQTYSHITSDIGGGNSTATGNNSGGNETIYIVAGVAVAAIVGYAVYKKFHKTEEDTAGSETAIINSYNINRDESLLTKAQNIKDTFPVNFIFAMKNENNFSPGNLYSVGLSFKF